MSNRPEWCLDSTCSPDFNHLPPGEGQSGWCCGRTEEPMVTERLGVRHDNDGHFCIRSPRGVVMLEVMVHDLDIMARVALHGLAARGRKQFNLPWYTGQRVSEVRLPSAEGSEG